MTTTNVYGRQVVEALTNKSGGGVIAGDVVVIDTSNDTAFTTTTSAGSTGTIGIAQETIASNATGRVLTAGYAALVNVNASVTRGNFGKTHTVVKQATDLGSSRASGAFCQFLTGGTTPTAHLFGITDATTGSGASGVPSGTSFPGSPATNDLYYRTDRALLYYYDGTRWLTVNEYSVAMGVLDVLFPVGATANNSYAVIDQGANGCWATRVILNATSTANDGSNFHTCQVKSKTPGGTLTNRGSSFTTAADTTGQAVNHSVAIGAALGSTETQMLVTYTRTGIANIYVAGTFYYRLIG